MNYSDKTRTIGAIQHTYTIKQRGNNQMTIEEKRKEVEQKREAYLKAQAELENYDVTLRLPSLHRPFKEWHLHEQNALYNINKNAYMYLLEHKDLNIHQYNEYTLTASAKLDGLLPVLTEEI